MRKPRHLKKSRNMIFYDASFGPGYYCNTAVLEIVELLVGILKCWRNSSYLKTALFDYSNSIRISGEIQGESPGKKIKKMALLTFLVKSLKIPEIILRQSLKLWLME